MKSAKYQRRSYRKRIAPHGLYPARVVTQETDLHILTDRPADEEFLRQRTAYYRRQIEGYIAKDPRFLAALKPIAVELRAPGIVRKMARAAAMAGVGPMASVAGAIAEFLGRDLLKKGCREVIIENGGDIFLSSPRDTKIGIYSGKPGLFKNLSLKIKAKDTPLGICTSSGRVGHSLSFGLADAAVILARSATLADSVATATANRVKSPADLKKAMAFARSVKGILGAVIILGNNLVSWGKIQFAQPLPD